MQRTWLPFAAAHKIRPAGAIACAGGPLYFRVIQRFRTRGQRHAFHGRIPAWTPVVTYASRKSGGPFTLPGERRRLNALGHGRLIR